MIVEIKTARGDLLGDGEWPDYLEFCDRFYWGLPPGSSTAPASKGSISVPSAAA